MFTRLIAEAFLYTHSSPKDKEWCSAFVLSLPPVPSLPSLLYITKQDVSSYFRLCIGQWQQNMLVLWLSSRGCHGVGIACCPLFSSRDLLLPWKVLSSTEQGSAGLGLTPAHCRDLCLYMKLPDLPFPNILLVTPNSGLIQVQSSKTLEVLTVLGISPCHPTDPATHKYPASGQISGWCY